MPFDDEISDDGVRVVTYRTIWPLEFERLGGSLASLLGPVARRIEHVGSTSVPGLAAKDCVDVQVPVEDVASPSIDALMSAAGYRQRPEPWNLVERSFGIASSKLVYAPPVGARAVNIHVRRSVPDIYDYGQIKTPATEILMHATARWAADVDWAP